MTTLAKLIPLSALGLGLGLGLAWFGTAPRDGDAAANHASVPPERSPAAFAAAPSTDPLAPKLSAAPPAPAPSSAPRTAAAPASPPTLSPEDRAALFEKIEVAYTTYSPEALPKLAPYLRHPDPEIRAFARDAVVQLGHADGVALLRAAAEKTSDPREKLALVEAAEFLELPPAAPVSGTFKVVADESGRPGSPRSSRPSGAAPF